ncbi:MAG: hypothetical protein IKA01_05640 [Alistipes sp.]|nr:hypothetical protein [Alistipes sp.]
MDIWRIFQIVAGVFAAVATALTVVAFYFPATVYLAMWMWTCTLWQIQFLVPMPVIERNKNDNKILYSLSFFVSVFLAVDANTLLQEKYPATDGFSRGVLVYSLAYLVVSLLLAGWLKIKEKKKNK